MKTQMRFQKILMLITLVIAALCIVYAITFFSGTLYKTYKYLEAGISNRYKAYVIGADDFFFKGQEFVSTMIVMGIVFLLIVVANYITASNTRRNYYITNYISIIAATVFALVVAVYGIIGLSQVVNLYTNGINWETYNALWSLTGTQALYVATNFTPLEKFSPMFVIGYILYAVVAINAVVLVLNLVWKIKLMQGEKALLNASNNKEAA